MSLSSNTHIQYVVDIGNTNVHCGVVGFKPLRCLHRHDFPIEHLRDQLLPVLKQLSRTSRIPISNPVIIGGGTESTIAELSSILNGSSIELISFHYSNRMPFTMKYDNTPGADRIAGMLYCAETFPERNCITISAGTAITVNILFKNVFMGGAIFPGIATQLRSLGRYTSALPLIVPDGPAPLPGHSTETCIRSGVLYGISGGIERIIQEFQSIPDTDCIVCASGGDWPYLHRYFTMSIHYDPDMILSGLALAHSYL